MKKMSRLRSALLVGLGVVALAVPVGAAAKHGESHGKAKGHSKPRNVGYVFKGFYAGDEKVDVERGNAHVRKGGLVGETVAFDFSDARFVVNDTNTDGNLTLDDVATGDWVLVKARLPRKDPGSQPFEARRLIDKTNPPPTSD